MSHRENLPGKKLLVETLMHGGGRAISLFIIPGSESGCWEIIYQMQSWSICSTKANQSKVNFDL